jgi:drug/metabolite transporter (DMT)-like permease
MHHLLQRVPVPDNLVNTPHLLKDTALNSKLKFRKGTSVSGSDAVQEPRFKKQLLTLRQWTMSSDHHHHAPTNPLIQQQQQQFLIPFVAAIYILSGICQPLLMTACKSAGLADSSAQLYMLFYYAGPSLLLFTIVPYPCRNTAIDTSQRSESHVHLRPSRTAIGKAVMVAIFDIVAQSFNYTGASLAGASIFAVIYSSVTIWTAVFSRIILHRSITRTQCVAIAIVFGGLCITGFDSMSLGSDVVHGAVLIFFGSCLHGATYVLSEAIMITSSSIVSTSTTVNEVTNKSQLHRDLLTVFENSAVQGIVACIGLLLWQLIYTLPRWDVLILQPASAAGTTILQATILFVSFSVSNLLHSVSFYYTVAHYPGGSTSAGVMKGLQAVLVFVAAHMLYCGRNHSVENNSMCFSTIKVASLITVVSGVGLFRSESIRTSTQKTKNGYTIINNASSDSSAVTAFASENEC